MLDTTLRVEKITSYHWLLFVICVLSNVFGGTVSTLMSVYLPIVAKDLLGEVDIDNLSFISAYVNSVFILGWAIGGMAWGILSDRIGRSRAMVLSIGSYGLFTILTGFTNSWELIMLCRFLSGFGVGGVLVVTPTILSEVWPEKSRGIFIGVLSIGFPIGIFSAGLIDYLVSNWHEAFFVGMIPLGLSVVGVFSLRESEKWVKTKNEEGVQKPGIMFDKSHRNNLLVGSVTFGTMLIGLWGIFSWLPTWVQTIIPPGGDGQHERGLSMMVLGAGGLIGGFLSGWLSKGVGNRRAMMLCFAVCFAMSFLLFKVNSVFSNIIYIEIALLALFFGASQGVLSAYIPELFPSTIRATATGFCFNIGRFVTATVVFFVGALVVILGGYGNAIFTFSLVFVIGLIATFYSRKD
ncbi:MFS transporter [soil metagenome]